MIKIGARVRLSGREWTAISIQNGNCYLEIEGLYIQSISIPLLLLWLEQGKAGLTEVI